ncbi:MAG: diacylglycerol kinase family lipid kinase [Candidatus Hydrogenedentes bacterium]|nr:diacylglycerol kinase family lipid kinase [Candidatus Hydrogenedentota bacterium]
MKTAAIVNPRAGHGRCERRWAACQGALRDAVGPLKYCPTEYPGHGSILARELLRAGYDHLISAGGDGTHFEVVNGWFEHGQAINPAARLTVLPMGTGSDLAKVLGIAPGLRGIAALRDAEAVLADAGCLTCATDPGGPARTFYFLNIAHFGIGGAACRYVNEHSKALGGFLSYLRAILVMLARYRAKAMHITLDGSIRLDGPALDFSVAKGCYDAGGLHLAPHARLDNGQFDCFHVGPIGFLDALRTLPKLYTGRLSERRDVVTYLRATRVEASADEAVEVEIDGEFVGYLPATVVLIPGAIQLTRARREG